MTSDDGALVDGRLRWLRRRFENDPRARWFLPYGRALLEVGFIDDALEVLERGTASDPDSIGGWVLLGRAYLQAGRLDDALAAFERVVGRDRENSVALRGLAEIHRRRGARTRAADYYRALLRLMPWDLEAQKGMAQVLGPPGDLVGRVKRTSPLLIPPDLAEVRAAVMGAGDTDPEQRYGALPHREPVPESGQMPAAPAPRRAANGAVEDAKWAAPVVAVAGESASAEVVPVRQSSEMGEPAPAPARQLRPDAEGGASAQAPQANGRMRGERGLGALPPESRPARGIFEPPPHDLGGKPAGRRATARRRPRQGGAPPPSFNKFLQWVEIVSEQGSEDPTEE